MSQLIIMEQTIIPIANVNDYVSIKSSFANYQRASATKNSDALIDILDGAIILLGNSTEPQTIESSE